MTCDHAEDRKFCRETCARCGHICPVHRAEVGGRGVGGAGCWECGCGAWLERTGVALLDEAVVVHLDDRHAPRRQFRASIWSHGKPAGRVLLHAGRQDDEVAIKRVRLRPEFRGRSIAAEVYAELARRIAPMVLTSGARGDEHVWKGQVTRGHATFTRAGYFRLESPPERPPTWRNGG